MRIDVPRPVAIERPPALRLPQSPPSRLLRNRVVLIKRVTASPYDFERAAPGRNGGKVAAATESGSMARTRPRNICAHAALPLESITPRPSLRPRSTVPRRPIAPPLIRRR